MLYSDGEGTEVPDAFTAVLIERLQRPVKSSQHCVKLDLERASILSAPANRAAVQRNVDGQARVPLSISCSAADRREHRGGATRRRPARRAVVVEQCADCRFTRGLSRRRHDSRH